MKYKNKDLVYYQNNKASFVTYLTPETAVLIVDALPDFENTDITGTCEACMAGDSDNKLSCDCDRTEYVLEVLQDNTDPTKIPLIVNTKLIHDKPIVLATYENELKLLGEKRKRYATEINKDNIRLRTLTLRLSELEKEIRSLEQHRENLAQLPEPQSLESFCNTFAISLSRIMYSENDSRKVVGGAEVAIFIFDQRKYNINVNAFWEKSLWCTVEVNGLDSDYKYSIDILDF